METTTITLTPGLMVILGSLVSGLVGTIALLFKNMLAAKDAQLADMQHQRNAFREIVFTTSGLAEVATNAAMRAMGKPPMASVAAVVAEHHSPATDAQQATASLATVRARVAAIVKSIEVMEKELTPEYQAQKDTESVVTAKEEMAAKRGRFV